MDRGASRKSAGRGAPSFACAKSADDRTDTVADLPETERGADMRRAPFGAKGGDRKQREFTMNRDELKGNWKQVRGKAREKWGKLTDDDLDQIQGRTEQLEGKLQERYGKTREEARKEVEDFCHACG